MSALTVAICDWCWHSLNPDRDPYQVLEADTEQCHYCGGATNSGIYIRVEVSQP